MGIMNITVNGGAWPIRRLARPSPRRASQYRSFNGGSRRFTAENHRVPVAEIESFFSFKTAGILAVFYRFPRRTFRPIRFRIGRLVTASSLPHRRRNLGLRLLTIPRHIDILHFQGRFQPSSTDCGFFSRNSQISLRNSILEYWLCWQWGQEGYDENYGIQQGGGFGSGDMVEAKPSMKTTRVFGLECDFHGNRRGESAPIILAVWQLPQLQPQPNEFH
nr:hypothetical protein Iba_scaffold38198CG0370 [Ipomoea batatas]GMD62429.1 hypothetical protein Iba_scaffold48997CG0010 [Ipomoea batatas]